MKSRWLVSLVLGVFLFSMAPPVDAAEGDKIVRTKSLNGLPVVSGLCALLGCQVLGSLDLLPGDTTSPSSLFLVRGLLENTVTWLLSLLGIAAVEPDRPVGLEQDPWGSSQASMAVLDRLWNRTPVTYYGSPAWASYLEQPALSILRVPQAHCGLAATGGAVVAVIDTGVHLGHPTLQGALVEGYDFTRNVGGGDEMADVGQASMAVLDGVFAVNQASMAVLDQASMAVLDGPEYAAFGHGTMVAGVVHAVAPTARLMPLKAFAASGEGYTSDILRAIYYATLKGAKVLNMSFSRATSSPELKRAIDNATGKGLIAVAAAGNDSSTALRYPAAYSNVIGVGSTTDADGRASFSNYGSSLVWVAAPGEGVITTYPWGSFAASWGTSFSAPFVSGTAALIAGLQGAATNSQAATAVSRAKPLSSTLGLGYGRLDVYEAVRYARSLWPSAPRNPVPDTCSTGVDWTEAP